MSWTVEHCCLLLTLHTRSLTVLHCSSLTVVHCCSYTVVQAGADAAPYPEDAEEDPKVDPPWLPWPSGLLLGFAPWLFALDCFARGVHSKVARVQTRQSS